MFSTSQKNTLLNLIKESGIDAREFTLTVSAEPLELRLTYKPEKFYFRVVYIKTGIDQNRQDVMRIATFSTPKPGLIFDTKNEHQHNGIDKWDTVLAIAGQWLKLLKAEFKQPDLWAELEQTPDIIIEDAEIMEDRFTPLEIKLLQERIIGVEAHVVALNLPQQTEDAIVEVIREMPAKAKRLTKKELWEVLFSTILRESLRAGLTTEHTSDIIKTRHQLFYSPI